jgi:MFS transporter, DHA2 family, multidrug resistance protein
MTPSPPRAGTREWIGLAVLALPSVIYAMDLTVLNLAVPQLTRDLAPSAAELLWIVDIYGFLVAGALVTMGTLGDRIGRRRLLLIGAAAFGAASAIAAFAQSPTQLIAARALQGIAGATLAPSTLSLIRNLFLDETQRQTAIAVWIASFSAGGALGPVLGGVLLEHYWWGSVFLVNLPVMALLLALGPFLLPEFRDPAPGPLDLGSAALSLLAVLAVIFGLKDMAEHGPAARAIAAIVAGAVLGLVFVRRQRSLVDPFIDLKLFEAPAFRAALTINVFGAFFISGLFLFIAQYQQLVLGLSPLQAGLWSLPAACAFIVGSAVVPVLASRLSVRVMMIGGLAVAAAGFSILLSVRADGSLPALVAGSVVFSFGFTPVAALTTDIVVSAAPPERAGSAAALSETAFELGGALGIALLGSLAAAIYRLRMLDGVPDGLAPAAAEAARATLGGAVAVAEGSPAVASSLLPAARAAFTEGFVVSAGLALVIAVGLMALARVALRSKDAPPPAHG